MSINDVKIDMDKVREAVRAEIKAQAEAQLAQVEDEWYDDSIEQLMLRREVERTKEYRGGVEEDDWKLTAQIGEVALTLAACVLLDDDEDVSWDNRAAAMDTLKALMEKEVE